MTPAAKPQPLAVQLRQIRRRRRITQEDLAAAIGVDNDTLGNWERGRFDQWLMRLTAWADALNYDLVLVWRGQRRRDPGWRREMQDPPRRSTPTIPKEKQ